MVWAQKTAPLTGLGPVIHVFQAVTTVAKQTWMPGTRPGTGFIWGWGELESGGFAPASLDDLPQRVEADAMAEIAEPFIADPRGGPQREQRVERLG
jgi:hypothetical protein